MLLRMLVYSMANGLVDKVVVGADRIVKTGHVFNKIGTYQVAITFIFFPLSLVALITPNAVPYATVANAPALQ